MKNNFCIFIISHGRPNNVITLRTLIKDKCTLPIYIVIDNCDKTAKEYIAKYKDMIIVFDKIKYAKMVDNYDNFDDYRSTTHARNACFDIAKKLGYEYFLVLDDDYTAFRFRIDRNIKYLSSSPIVKKNIDEIFLATLDYYKKSNFTSICYSQGGDWFAGEKFFYKRPKRKAMNSFFCSINRRFWFRSRLNEDVNTYLSLGHQGYVFMTIPFIQINQNETQKTKGGMTDAYINNGTYVKSFYTILTRPDCTKIALMGLTNKRLHHKIDWESAAPMIIDEKYKK